MADDISKLQSMTVLAKRRNDAMQLVIAEFEKTGKTPSNEYLDSLLNSDLSVDVKPKAAKELAKGTANLEKRKVDAIKSGDTARAVKYQGMIDTNTRISNTPISGQSLLGQPDSVMDVPIPSGAVNTAEEDARQTAHRANQKWYETGTAKDIGRQAYNTIAGIPGGGMMMRGAAPATKAIIGAARSVGKEGAKAGLQTARASRANLAGQVNKEVGRRGADMRPLGLRSSEGATKGQFLPNAGREMNLAIKGSQQADKIDKMTRIAAAAGLTGIGAYSLLNPNSGASGIPGVPEAVAGASGVPGQVPMSGSGIGQFDNPNFAPIAYDQVVAGNAGPARSQGPTMNAWGSGADPQFEAAMNARFAQENAQVDAMAAAQQQRNEYFNPFGAMSEYGDLQR